MTLAKSRLDALYKNASRSTLVFGHRGASKYAPMNTLTAFELAAEQGADGVELDVHRTKDGELVIVHDFTVDKTTDGSGVVQEMTLAELKSLDAGRWFSDEFVGVRVPTLGEVFEAVGQKLIINVEIKSVTQDTDGVEQLIADMIVAHNMEDRVIVSSFNPLALHRFRAISPDIPIGFLYMAGEFEEAWALIDNLPHEARHPYHEMIDASYIDWARENDYRVNTWTVNSLERAEHLAKLGTDLIITDHPDKIIAKLGG